MNEMGDLADGDLTVRATVSEDITGAIADSVNYTIEELAVLVRGINDAAERVTSASNSAQSTSNELLAATKVLPIHVAAFMGVIAMVLTGCVRLHGVGRALSLQVVLLVASSIALGLALVSTGAAAWVARGVTFAVEGLPPSLQLAAFMGFAALLTNFVSNSAAAAVGTPIAVATATQLGSPLEPFVLAILFGANLSFATPMAYQTNVLVMDAARYRFADFVRVGGPLVLLMLATLSFLLARRYGL